ncbi:MAG: hypothetical protein ACRC62_26310 [Microcoleus sp.]
MITNLPIKLERLPKTLPREGAVSIELAEGVLMFRASKLFQERIEILKSQQKEVELTAEELQELQDYEELNNYLIWVNQMLGNSLHYPLQGMVSRYDDPFEPAVPVEDWEALQ